MNFSRPFCSSCGICLLCLFLLISPSALPLFAKTAIDFNPDLNFSRYKTFAFIGGVENLTMLQLDPQLMYDRIHQTVTRELTRKGLREVQPGQNPDLVVRYWVNPSSQVNVATMGNWAPFRPYIGSYWAETYDNVSATSGKDDSLIIDLIDLKTKDLAWRLYLIRKITTPDKEWKKADDELTRAFGSFPPSDKEKDEKKKDRAAHPAKPDQP
jgi:Domain of unknown function (DUF4136)